MSTTNSQDKGINLSVDGKLNKIINQGHPRLRKFDMEILKIPKLLLQSNSIMLS